MPHGLIVPGRPPRPSSQQRSGPELQEECGLFGVFGHPQAALLSYLGLFALQHRGQESAGIAVWDGEYLDCEKGMGLVGEVFERAEVAAWPGSAAVGHVRYPTCGSSDPVNAQPLVVRTFPGTLALAHNGELTDAGRWRADLEQKGAIFQTTSDTEVIAHLVSRSGRNEAGEALLDALGQVHGGFAVVVLSEGELFCARDPNGIRPLSIGRLGDAWLVASETCAIDSIGGEFVRDVEQGELVSIGEYGIRSAQFAAPGRPALCAFEYIYFARPDSDVQGKNVHQVRKELGRRLVRAFPVDADLVTGVPDSSVSAAIGYAEESGLPNEIGLIKNRYIGRTFIEPTQEGRELAVRLKLNPLRQVVKGQRVVLVDDSIVRGTTSRHIVGLLRQAGAAEVHLRITSPPYRCPCFYGIDTSSSAELIAARKSVEEIRQAVDADTLAYQTLSELTGALGYRADQLCLSCFNGDYPVPPPEGATSGEGRGGRQGGLFSGS
ncbi:MAG: amidophosphoribosyltransferase [Bacillota bacterium]|nr:amidophosphoribosyltransferase [Bacillota bacterium]